MTARTTPPFRADHVGSFLRPKYLLDARERKAKGEITAAELRAVEDRAITEIVKFQEDVGLQSITDGEFRRTYFHIDFLDQLGGVKTDIPVTITKPDGTQELAPPVMRVVDKVRHVKDIQRADFEYLKSQVSAGRTPKVTIPSPTMLHFRGGRAGHQPRGLPRARAGLLRRRRAPTATNEVARGRGLHLRADGRHQHGLPLRREDARGRRDPAATIRTSCRTATRSSSTGRRAQAGGDDAGDAPVPRQLQEHARRGRQLRAGRRGTARRDEPRRLLHGYDDDRSGDFRPLRYLPKGKIVVPAW